MGGPAVSAEAGVDRVRRGEEQGVRATSMTVRDDRDERSSWRLERRQHLGDGVAGDFRQVDRQDQHGGGAGGDRLGAAGVDPAIQANVALAERPRPELLRQAPDGIVRRHDEGLGNAVGRHGRRDGLARQA
jgi:hypothetical protein